MLTDEMKAQGWVEHDGGPCPVEPEKRVHVMLGNGQTTTYRADGFRWDQDSPPHRYDIIAYKPEQPNG